MERQFEHQIDKLRKRVLKMSSLVDEQVEFAFRAIDEENLELAQLVIDRDDKVDKYDVKIDKLCQKLIALNQPVAMDLRYIMSSITINTNLERIGDIATNIAENFLFLKYKPPFLSRIKFNEMADLAKGMIKSALDAFINNDPKLAEEVIKSDDLMDKYNIENHQILKQIMKEDPENIDAAVTLLVISRQIERLGDHATNIAEDVYFIVEAQMIKHKYEKYLFPEDEDSDEDDETRTSQDTN
jgi:phosphate transport system protein